MADTGRDIVEYLQEFHKEERTAIKGRELCVLFNLTDKQYVAPLMVIGIQWIQRI